LLSRRVLLVTLAGIVALAAVIVIYPPALDALLARGGSYRVATWLRYLAFAWEHPLVGTGLNQRLWLTVDGAELHHAHNMLISALVRGGLIGLAGMAAMLAGGLYYAWRHAVRSGNPVIFGMILALAVAGTFDYDLILTRMDWMWLTFWLPIGLAAGGELYVRGLSPAGSTATMPTT
jgi:O-antigen ligase